MPRVDGIEAIRRLAARGDRPRAIALTTYADDASVLGALRAGARGYLTKDAGADEIRAAVEAVARGEAALDPSVQHHVVAALAGGAADADAEPELPDELTPREAEVLGLIAEGLTNAEIAERLVVSARDGQDARQPHLRQGRRARPRAGRRLRVLARPRRRLAQPDGHDLERAVGDARPRRRRRPPAEAVLEQVGEPRLRRTARRPAARAVPRPPCAS